MPAIHYRWVDVPSESIGKSIERKFVTGQRVTVGRFEMKRGGVVPRHSHEQEQMTCVMSGVLKFTIDGRETIVGQGEVLDIGSWVEHEVEVLEDALVVDVFSPVRQDWIDKTDNYFAR